MSTNQDRVALELTQAMHATGRRLLDAKPLPPATSGLTPMLNITIAVHPTSDVTVAKEIELVKSALLYADHVTLCSPAYELLASMAALAQADADTRLQFIAEVIPIIQPANGPLAQGMKRILGTEHHRSSQEMSAYQNLKRMLPAQWKPIADLMNKFYSDAGARELQEPISKGLLDIDFLDLPDTSTEALVQSFTRRLQEYLANSRAYPMFDDEAGNMVRAGLKEGAFTVTAEAMRRAGNAGLGTGLIDRLPSFPKADMRAVLEIRNEVEQHVGRFRRAVTRLRNEISSSAVDREFDEEVDQIFVAEVRAAIEEIQAALQSSSLGKSVIAHGKEQVGPGALALGMVALQQWPLLVKVGVTGVAAAVGVAAAQHSVSAAKTEAQGNDLFFLYRTQIELDQRS